ncbi:hypothetical protein ACFB49_40590 [Sphingomonas sp. DBB INV C78]
MKNPFAPFLEQQDGALRRIANKQAIDIGGGGLSCCQHGGPAPRSACQRAKRSAPSQTVIQAKLPITLTVTATPTAIAILQL